jgi:uncharacterized membrane protein YczE
MVWRGYLLNQLNTSEQVHAEINEGPVDAFTFILFLFQHKHVVIKELLQLLVCEVNANLLKAVELIGRSGWRRKGKREKVQN